MGGSVGPDFSRFDIGEFLLESGRARCQFKQFAIDLTPGPDRRRMHVGGQVQLENWYAEDFLPLLTHPVRDGLPDHGTALGDLGLQTFSASLDAAIAVGPSGNVTIESMKYDGSCVLRVGDQPLPLTTTAGYDPGAHRIFARAEIVGLRPAQFKPRLAQGLPVAPAVFDFPASLQLEAGSTVPEGFPDTPLPPPDVRVTIHGGPGTFHRCDFLAMDTPVRNFDLEADAALAGLVLRSFRAKADFEGPVVSVDSLRASFGNAPAAEVAVHVSDLPLDWLLGRVPCGMLPARASALLPKLAAGGVVRSLAFDAGGRLTADKEARPEIVALHFEGELEKPSARFDNWPAIAAGRIHVVGDARAARLEAVDLKSGPVRIPRMEITADQILGDARTAAGTFTVQAQLGEMPAFLKSLPAPVVLPENLDWSKLAGDLTAKISFAADLQRLPDPAAASGEIEVRVDGFSAPALPGRFETAPGSCEARLKLKNGVADLQGTLAANLRSGFDLVEGPLRVQFSARGETAGKAEASVAVDLKEARLRAPGLAWEKQAGSESSLEARMATPDFRCAGNAASAIFELTGKGLIYQQLKIKGKVDANLAPGGPQAVKLVCDPVEADATSLRLEANAAWPQSIDVTLSGTRLDLRPLVRLAAPRLAVLNAPAKPPPAAAAKGTTPAAAPAAPAAVTPAAGSPANAQATCLPAESKVSVSLQEVVLGGGRTLAPFQLQAQFHGARPIAGDFHFASLGHGFRATLCPGQDHPAWTLQIDEVGDLLAVGTAPLKELPLSMTAEGTTIGQLTGLPESFSGGRLKADGTIDPEVAAAGVRGRLQVADLRLRTEVPFFLRIAALAKRKLMITVPFKEFRIDAFTLGLDSLHLENVLLDGPITLTAEKLDLDFATTELFLRGKVFGIWFEVKGPLGNLQYYLSDKNTWIKSITTEDEFQW